MKAAINNKILIPTDFSENSKNAARYVLKMYHEDTDVEFVLLNSYCVPQGGSNTMLVSITDILKHDSNSGLKKMMKDMQEDINGKNVRTLSKHGSLNSVIEDLLEHEEFGLIVMGTRGAGGLKKVLLGSNTSEVVSNINRPILIVPDDAKYQTPDNMLFTTDFKPTKRDDQIETLLDFAKHLNSKIFILNINVGKKRLDIEKAKIESGLDKLFIDISHSYYEREGKDIVSGIDSFVNENNIKIIAMIVRKLSFFANLFHKSLTKEMAMHTRIPMLVLQA